MSQNNVEVPDVCNGETIEVWAEALGGLYKFVLAQNNLAAVLSRSPLINPIPHTPLLLDAPKSKSTNEYNLEDFPWFLNEMGNVHPSQNVKTTYFFTISPPQQSAPEEAREEVYSEPISLPHNVSFMDTQNMGDCSDVERALENMQFLEQSILQSLSTDYDDKVWNHADLDWEPSGMSTSGEGGSSVIIEELIEDNSPEDTSQLETSSTPKKEADESNRNQKLPHESQNSLDEKFSDVCSSLQEYTDSDQSFNSQNLQSACDSDENDEDSTYYEVSQHNKITAPESTVNDEQVNDVFVNKLLCDILNSVGATEISDAKVDAKYENSSGSESRETEDQELFRKSEEIQTVDKRRFQSTLRAVLAKTAELRKPLRSPCCVEPFPDAIVKPTPNIDTQNSPDTKDEDSPIKSVPRSIKELEVQLKALNTKFNPQIQVRPTIECKKLETHNKSLDRKSYAVSKKPDSPMSSASSPKSRIANSARYAHIESKVKTMLRNNKNVTEGEDKLSDYFTKAKASTGGKINRQQTCKLKESSKFKYLDQPDIHKSRALQPPRETVDKIAIKTTSRRKSVDESNKTSLKPKLEVNLIMPPKKSLDKSEMKPAPRPTSFKTSNEDNKNSLNTNLEKNCAKTPKETAGRIGIKAVSRLSSLKPRNETNKNPLNTNLEVNLIEEPKKTVEKIKIKTVSRPSSARSRNENNKNPLNANVECKLKKTPEERVDKIKMRTASRLSSINSISEKTKNAVNQILGVELLTNSKVGNVAKMKASNSNDKSQGQSSLKLRGLRSPQLGKKTEISRNGLSR